MLGDQVSHFDHFVDRLFGEGRLGDENEFRLLLIGRFGILGERI